MSIDLDNFNAFGTRPRKVKTSAPTDSPMRADGATDGALRAAFVESFGADRLADIESDERRWSWVEIDLGAIRHNTYANKRCLKPGTRLMAVVKADGYGHGAVQVARTALSAGASQLAVATVDEGIELRRAGIAAPILILSEPPASAAPLLLQHDIMPSVYTPEFAIAYAELADAHGMRAPYHLALNTGMNRIGVRHDEVVEFARQISFHRALDQVGTFTHFATADCAETLDFNLQFRRFADAIEGMRVAGIDPGIVHCANSAALLRYPETHMDMVRMGISLYGFHPCPETRGAAVLKPAMSVHARITAVNAPQLSEGVGYGLHYRSTGSVRICTVPVGYADGFARALSGRTDFIYGGRRCHQVGNICMDQSMFEVDMRSLGTRPRLDPQVGDEVVVIGEKDGLSVGVEELCDVLGTIPYEVCCALAMRMPKVYVR
ncbi:alanine racemase [Slackia exigua]|uniref:alanine racemase n=1 Tax=Slackia exigua TaxID=84109 RepID=UPI0028EDFCBD|nr:alanine racemase [Slackia exigua]